jgi:DNA-binding LacI/PurR family transcriptional regulator
MSEEYSFLFSFENQSPDYALGFEAGRAWQIIQENKPEFFFMYNSENALQIVKMAKKMGYEVKEETEENG